MKEIRNFSIIAHIDHGKSTLADRILEMTGAIDPKKMKEQVLDSMDLERERGITIKLTTCTFDYKSKNGKTYKFNLIDTPGHVDFSYEVSRSLKASEGALLVVDATQGIEAQTVSNTNLALNNKLKLIPIINKIDLKVADPERAKNEIEDLLCIEKSQTLKISAKTGSGVVDVLEAIIQKIPAPKIQKEIPLKALIFDCHFDPYLGVVAHVRIFDGKIKKDAKILLMNANKKYEVTQVGIFSPAMKEMPELSSGDVGFITATIKNIKEIRVGETITESENPTKTPLSGYKPAKSMVFVGLYPAKSEDNNFLRQSIEKLQLNDSAFTFTPEMSAALGMGFRCGFLGLLHAEIVQERLEREFGLNLISTTPSVVYKINLANGETLEIDNPSKMPDRARIESLEEPFVKTTIFTPPKFIGNVMELCKSHRGEYISMEQTSKRISVINFHHPLSEIIVDFFDKLKSNTKGYASLDYHFIGFRKADLVKLDILVNKTHVDALSIICFKKDAARRGRVLVEKLRKVIHRQQYEVIIQAAIGGRIIASDRVKPVRKNVTGKCYGGDITRKRKLLEKQKKGKKRMKALGSIEIPEEAFREVLKK